MVPVVIATVWSTLIIGGLWLSLAVSTGKLKLEGVQPKTGSRWAVDILTAAVRIAALVYLAQL